MDARYRQLVEAASWAPSGENAQPWRFIASGSGTGTVLDIKVAADRDRSPYNWNNRASYVAVGAAIENILLVAPTLGLNARVELLPDDADALHAARITFGECAARAEPLAEYVRERTTNRKPFKKEPLKDAERASLNAAAQAEGADLRLIETREGIGKLAAAAATQERILFANRSLHHFFFSHINWNDAEDIRNKAGFFIDTLELVPPARLIMKLLRSWRRARICTRLFRINALISGENAKLYASCAAVGALFSKDDTPREALRAGMTIQRVWLEATRHGLYIQPLAGITFLVLASRGDGALFSDPERQLLTTASAAMDTAFSPAGKTCYFMFRIGHADLPSAHARRFSVDEILTTV
jgi:nitroreductase